MGEALDEPRLHNDEVHGDGTAADVLLAAADIVTPLALRAAATLRLVDRIDDGTDSVDSLVDELGADQVTLAGLIDYLVACGVLVCTGSVLSIPPAGAPLRSTHPSGLRDRLDQSGVFGRSDLAFVRLAESVTAGMSAYELQFGGTYWEDIDRDPELARSFHSEMAKNQEWVLPLVETAVELDGVATVVDVGGGSGAILRGLLRSRPGLQGVLFDRPAAAQFALAEAEAADLADRLRFVGGDFFESIPSSGDLYLLSMVLHDWPDREAETIVSRCVEAMGPDASMVVVEFGPDAHPDEKTARLVDLHLAVCARARQRTEAETIELLGRCGLGKVQRVSTTGGVLIVQARVGSS